MHTIGRSPAAGQVLYTGDGTHRSFQWDWINR